MPNVGRIGSRGAVAVGLVVAAAGCLRTVDLRGAEPGDGDDAPQPADVDCPAGERYQPGVGCSVCIVRTPPPEEQCPCSWDFVAAAFPYCDSPDADYRCLGCDANGDIVGCAAHGSDGSIRDCAQLAVCCAQIAQGDSPCCPEGQTLVCYPQSGGFFPNAYACEG